MAEKKQTFIMCTDWGKAVELMSDESAGRLLKAVFAYEETDGEEVPTLSADVAPIFSLLRAFLDDNRKKYAEKCEQNKRNIEQRWRGEEYDRIPSNTNEYDRIRTNTTGIRNDTNSIRNDTNRYLYDNDYEYDNDYDNNTCEGRAGAHAHTREGKRFVKPTVDEITAYCAAKGFYIDAQAFIDHYDSCGWVIGKNKPMKDWRAAVNKWHRKDVEDGKEYTPPSISKREDTRTPEEKTIEDIPPGVRDLYGSYAEYWAVKNQ